MRRMNFRQRISWLMVAFYLLATCAIVYYIFEISDKFNEFALDHMNTYHKVSLEASETKNEANPEGHSSHWGVLSHVADIPLFVWLLLCLLPYFQVFAMLLACTKPSPQVSMAYMWPIYSYMWCRDRISGTNSENELPSKQHQLALNGKTVLNT